MPRKNHKGRNRPTKKEVRMKSDRVIEVIEKFTNKDRDIYPGWIVAAAEYRGEEERHERL